MHQPGADTPEAEQVEALPYGHDGRVPFRPDPQAGAQGAPLALPAVRPKTPQGSDQVPRTQLEEE